MPKYQIRKVKDLEVGQTYRYDGVVCYIRAFPTRTSISLRGLHPLKGRWADCKMTVKEFRKTAERITIPVTADEKY